MQNIIFAFTESSMSTSSLEEILVIHRLSERDLTQVCSKEHRGEFTKRLNDWKAVGGALGFTQEELDMIDSGFQTEEQKKTTLLFQWSMRDKKEATYLNLAKSLFAGELLDLLQELCVLLTAPRTTPTTPAGQHPIKPAKYIQILIAISLHWYSTKASEACQLEQGFMVLICCIIEPYDHENFSRLVFCCSLTEQEVLSHSECHITSLCV